MGQLFSRCQDGESQGYGPTLDCQVGLASALWRWRGRPDELLRAIRDPLTAGARGERVRRADGFSEGPPRTVPQIETMIGDGLANEEALIEVSEGAIERYQRIAAFLAAHDSVILGTSIPYAPVYMDAAEAKLPGFGASWQDAIGTLAEGTGIPFVDPVRFGDWWGDGSSQDIKHLSREGAVEFTRQLWDIPEFRTGVTEALE